MVIIEGSLVWLHDQSLHQKIKFSIEDFFSKCDQIRIFLWIWSRLLKKSLHENVFFVQENLISMTGLKKW